MLEYQLVIYDSCAVNCPSLASTVMVLLACSDETGTSQEVRGHEAIEGIIIYT